MMFADEDLCLDSYDANIRTLFGRFYDDHYRGRRPAMLDVALLHTCTTKALLLSLLCTIQKGAYCARPKRAGPCFPKNFPTHLQAAILFNRSLLSRVEDFNFDFKTIIMMTISRVLAIVHCSFTPDSPPIDVPASMKKKSAHEPRYLFARNRKPVPHETSADMIPGKQGIVTMHKTIDFPAVTKSW